LGAWFFLILGPTSSFLPSAGEAAAERRMYLPLAAVVTLVVVGALEAGKRLFNKQQGVVLGCVAGGSVVVLFTLLTVQRNHDYNSAVSIWQDTVEKRPNNARAHNGLGLALMQAGKVQEAISQYGQALHLEPDYFEASINLGIALVQLGRLSEAIGQYEQALRIKPDSAEAHYNLGNTLRRVGKATEAIGHYEQALRIQPNYADVHHNFGVALEKLGRTQEAIQHYEQALRIKPDFTQAQNALARLQAGQ
jgi:tetratricopeptide (TPR) repeat protein